jgi:hypothetical protein
VTGEAALALGVLRQALLDANSASPGVRLQAEGWLTSAEASFEFWCHVAGLHPEVARVAVRALLEQRPEPAPRPARAARRLPEPPVIPESPGEPFVEDPAFLLKAT